MRDTTSTMEFINALCGHVLGKEAAGGTGYGASVDTIGFQDVLACVSIGFIGGTAEANVKVTVTMEESTTANGTFTTITDGAINGSFTMAVDTIAATAGTYPPLYMMKMYERLGSTNAGGGRRMRFIRPKVTLTGTAASNYGACVSVAMLLGRPTDTAWIRNPSIYSTGNRPFEYGGGSIAPSYKSY